jgi:hypothetical protein
MNIKTTNGTINLTYEEVCHRLGFIPEAHFVKVTNRGTIDFTLGKPNEIRALKSAVTREGLVMSKKLKVTRI